MTAPKFRKNFIQFQVLGMMRYWNHNFRLTRMRGEAVKWIGRLQPTPLSEEYEVEIRYQVGDFPRVYIRKPTLTPRTANEKIPHTYEGNRLCLYLPRAKEWTRHMLIAETIVPWTSLWLYHYEVWHMTGEWLGGGVHPGASEPEAESDT